MMAKREIRRREKIRDVRKERASARSAPSLERLPRETELNVDKLVGSDVRDADGHRVGRVTDVVMDADTGIVKGLALDRGLLGRDYFVPLDGIASISDEGAVLNSVLAEDIVGKDVYDARGKRIGHVKEVHIKEESEDIQSITVGRGLFRQDIMVAGTDITSVGENVMLGRALAE